MIMTHLNKALSLVFVAAFLGVMVAPPAALGQHGKHAENHDTRQREGHAEGPAAEPHRGQKGRSAPSLRHTAMKALVLPALADTLGLSADQERRLEDARGSFLSEQAARKERLHSQKKALHELMRGEDRPEPAAVQERLTALAEKRAALKAAPYEVAMEMREVLTDEQRNWLDELSPRARHHEVMVHMTMKEHMHLKRALHGGHHGQPGRHGEAGQLEKGGEHGAGKHEGPGSPGSMKHHGSEKGANHGQDHGGAGN